MMKLGVRLQAGPRVESQRSAKVCLKVNTVTGKQRFGRSILQTGSSLYSQVIESYDYAQRTVQPHTRTHRQTDRHRHTDTHTHAAHANMGPLKLCTIKIRCNPTHSKLHNDLVLRAGCNEAANGLLILLSRWPAAWYLMFIN